MGMVYTNREETLELKMAEQLIIDDHEDTWDCEDCQSAGDMLDHVENVLYAPGEDFVPGSMEYEMTDDPELDAAYVLFLKSR